MCAQTPEAVTVTIQEHRGTVSIDFLGGDRHQQAAIPSQLVITLLTVTVRDRCPLCQPTRKPRTFLQIAALPLQGTRTIGGLSNHRLTFDCLTGIEIMVCRTLIKLRG